MFIPRYCWTTARVGVENQSTISLIKKVRKQNMNPVYFNNNNMRYSIFLVSYCLDLRRLITHMMPSSISKNPSDARTMTTKCIDILFKNSWHDRYIDKRISFIIIAIWYITLMACISRKNESYRYHSENDQIIIGLYVNNAPRVSIKLRSRNRRPWP